MASIGFWVAESPIRWRGLTGQGLESFQGKAQVRATFVPCQCVDLIHNHGVYTFQHSLSALTGQENEQRLRSGDENVWRFPDHSLALFSRGVTGANQGPDFWNFQLHLTGYFPNLLQGLQQVLANVVSQCLEGRKIKDLRGIGEVTLDALLNQTVDSAQEGRQCFPGAGGRSDQNAITLLDDRPAHLLRLGGLTESLLEPCG